MSRLVRQQHILFSSLLAAATFAAATLALAMGPVNIPYKTVVLAVARRVPGLGGIEASLPPAWETIIFDIRLPRVLLACVVGASLSAAGVAFQGLLRNPLADPYITGVSSGAALGAVIAILTGIPLVFSKHGLALLGRATIPAMAFLGGIGSVYAVLYLSRVDGRLPVDTFLLAGVVVGSFLWAVISFLMTLSGKALHEIVFWLMGSLSGRGWDDLWMALPWSIAGIAALYLFSRDLNILALGEEQAWQLGVEVEWSKLLIVLTSAMLTASAVAVSGIIGFIGLVVPHMTRIIVGPDHRLLLPTSLLSGALFLVAADTLARVILPPVEIPVGVITAMVGGPFFLYLLKEAKRHDTLRG